MLCQFEYADAQLTDLGPDPTFRKSQLPPMPYLPPNVEAAAENRPAILPPKENCNHGKKSDNRQFDPASTNNDPIAVKKPEVRVIGFTGINDPHPSEFQQKIDGTTERAILAYLETKEGTETKVRVINLCKDAFHSFYCQDIKPRKRITGAFPAHLRTSTSNIDEKIRPAGSFESPSRLLPESNKPPPFRIISTTRPEFSTTPKTSFKPYFNSFKPFVSTTTTTPFEIISTTRPFTTTLKPYYNTFKPFVSTTKPTTKNPYAFQVASRFKTTTEKIFAPSASQDDPQQQHPCDRKDHGLEPANTFTDPASATSFEEKRDPCKDIFHSFLCQPTKPKKSGVQFQPSSVIDVSNTKDSPVVIDPFQIQPPRAFTPFRKITQKPKINHLTTYHSTVPPHQCDQKEHQNEPQASIFDPSQIASAPATQLETKLQPSDVRDPCKDPFHSFLCQPTKPRKAFGGSQKRPATAIDAANTKNSPVVVQPPRTITTTTQKPRKNPLTHSTVLPHQCDRKEHQPQSSNSDPVQIAPAPATQLETKLQPNDVRDPCKDPFHSFLCQPTKPRKTLGQRRPLDAANSKDSPVVVQPPRTTSTTTTTQNPSVLNAEGTFEDPVAVGGYEYTKPSNKLEYPVRPSGYQYPVPKNPLQLPSNRENEGPAPEVIKFKRQLN